MFHRNHLLALGLVATIATGCGGHKKDKKPQQAQTEELSNPVAGEVKSDVEKLAAAGEVTPAPAPAPVGGEVTPAPAPAPVGGEVAPAPAPAPVGGEVAPAPAPVGGEVAPAPAPVGGEVAPAPVGGETTPALPPAANKNEIQGSWTTCVVQENDKGSTSGTYTFSADGKVEVKGKGFSDKECKVPYAEAEILAIKAQLVALYTAFGFPPAEAETLGEQSASILRGFTVSGTYSVGALLGNGAQALDLTLVDSEGAETSYLSFKIEGNTLKVAGRCEKVSEETQCKAVSGDTPENRAVDFTNKELQVLTRI